MDDVEDQLSQADWKAIPPATHVKTIVGSEVAVTLGIAGDFGGVGVTFELARRQSDGSVGSPVNILEARSAAGSGWQTSVLLRDQTKHQTIVFNQAAGNSTPFQWGYKNDYFELAAFKWNPVVSDHVHPNYNFSHSVATSPFDGSGYVLEDGRLHIGTNTVSVGSGSIVDITNQYTLRSRFDQTWEGWAAEQAFYLNKAVARSHHLRVFLRGASGGWSEGLIRPYDNYVVRNGQSTCDENGCSAKTNSLSYVLFIWEVDGSDIAVAIVPPNESCYGHLNMSRFTYGPNPTTDPDANGSIDWHTVVAAQDTTHFPAAAERPYQVRYLVGTPDQLSSLGYKSS
ncbi:hypothetical protein [Aquisphaera insulae]|uniref:hypothetical protein n=1 Tax=Aquisphaera insulae TaxID=2712864 RepID=UPI0013ED63F0|nr:hypothetical protein [Aquisphaera insulae]